MLLDSYEQSNITPFEGGGGGGGGGESYNPKFPKSSIAISIPFEGLLYRFSKKKKKKKKKKNIYIYIYIYIIEIGWIIREL